MDKYEVTINKIKATAKGITLEVNIEESKKHNLEAHKNAKGSFLESVLKGKKSPDVKDYYEQY